MKGKVCVVTGASSGIGRVTALELAKLGATVAMVCRNPERGEAARDEIREESRSETVHLLIADLSSQKDIRRVAVEIGERFDRLDVLVNNAGLALPHRMLTEDGIEMVFAVNHIAYFLLTNLLVDMLKKSAPARIVNVASQAHRRATLDLDDIELTRGYSMWGAYCRSKLANILFTYELARRLSGTGVTVNAVHPGTVRTNIWAAAPAWVRPILAVASPFMRSPEKGAETLVWLASSPEVEGMSGRYFIDLRAAQSSPLTYDEALARRLWVTSERLASLGAVVRNEGRS